MEFSTPFITGGSMQGTIRYCKNCGCRCHCVTTDCPNCINDVCVVCDCETEVRDIPESFVRRN